MRSYVLPIDVPKLNVSSSQSPLVTELATSTMVENAGFAESSNFKATTLATVFKIIILTRLLLPLKVKGPISSV